MDYAFTYFKDNGIMLEKDYPYTARNGHCKAEKSKYVEWDVTGYKDVRGVDELKLAC